MNTKPKQAVIPQGNQTSIDSRVKTPTFHVQTDLRAGWVPGQRVREGIRSFRASLPDDLWTPEIR